MKHESVFEKLPIDEDFIPDYTGLTNDEMLKLAQEVNVDLNEIATRSKYSEEHESCFAFLLHIGLEMEKRGMKKLH